MRISYIIMVWSVLAGCTTTKTLTGGKAFVGTVVYNVTIEGLAINQTRMDEARSTYGSEIRTSFLKNGDIVTRYTGNSNGVEWVYLDLESSRMLLKYEKSDTLRSTSAKKANFEKLNELRSGDLKHEQVVGKDCVPKGYYIHDKTASKGYNQYLTMKYWYSNEVLVDPSLYSQVATDLTGKVLSDSRGGIYLKKVLDYYTHQIVITAEEVIEGEVPDIRWIRKTVILPLD